MSLGTAWGLFRHYWVLIKLLITVFATVILMLHTRPVGQMAQMAAEMEVSGGHLLGARIQLLVASGAAVLTLLIATSLSVYKPRGLTL